MRLLSWLFVVAFLLLVGAVPAIASVIGATLGLVLAGGVELLAQPAVLGLALGGLAFVAFRRRPHARTA
ncbi:hypothetical protein [Streptomyces flavofungini]|uniref:hypothetical protein n=1 Tax=Streptomyces flavofungini TaxID=68200 RepID=UPI0034DF7BA6